MTSSLNKDDWMCVDLSIPKVMELEVSDHQLAFWALYLMPTIQLSPKGDVECYKGEYPLVCIALSSCIHIQFWLFVFVFGLHQYEVAQPPSPSNSLFMTSFLPCGNDVFAFPIATGTANTSLMQTLTH